MHEKVEERGLEKEREWRRGGSTESGACDGTCQQKVSFLLTLALVEVGCLGKRGVGRREECVKQFDSQQSKSVLGGIVYALILAA